MYLIILCILSVLTRHSVHSDLNSFLLEEVTPKSVETPLKRTYSMPLIFNQQTKQLKELNADDADKKCQRCLIGCPADTVSQPVLEKFNEEVSIGKRSIFEKNIVNENHEYAENKIIESANVCEVPFRPSMIRDEKMDTYETGYELYSYYKEGEVKMECRKYDELTSISTDFTKKKKKHTPVQKIFDSSIAIKYEIDNQTAFGIIGDDGLVLMFCWIPILSFKIDSSMHQIRARVNFKNDSSSEYETFGECNDYSLGSELFQSENDVNFYYSKPENMFEKIQVRQLLKHPETQAVGTLERVQIMPMMFLHTEAARLATCTYMNTMLVWSTIVEERLKLVDRYLYTIYKFWHPNVNIIFGVSDVMKVKLQDPEVKEGPTFPLPFFQPDLNKPEKIKIPKLIYRLVEYRMPKMDTYEMNYVVIVIHNHPSKTVTVKDRVCKYTTAGWEAILNKEPEKGLTYACHFSPVVNHKLGAYDKFDFPDGFLGTLQLGNIPPKNLNGATAEDYTDVRPKIRKLMKKLFPDQEIPEI